MATRHHRCLQVRTVVLYNGCPSPTTNFPNPKRVVSQYQIRLRFQQTSRRTLKSSTFPVSKSSSSMSERGSNPQPFPISVCSFSPNRLPNSIAASHTATAIVSSTHFYPSPLGKFDAGLSSALPGMCKIVSSHCAPIVHCTLSSCMFAPQTDVESMGPVCTTQHFNFRANLKTRGLECFSVSLSRLDLRQAFELLLDVLTPARNVQLPPEHWKGASTPLF